jgi:Flp pilus assembly protein TadD
VCLLIVAATLAIYNPVNSHPFVNYDDDRYVTENPHVRAGLGWKTVRWAFTSTEQANWHPLTWLSHALDCQLFGLNPAGHHFTSLLIHALSAALLFQLLVWATRRTGPSLLVAMLFALHPIGVESVAWVAERKNVLSAFFFLAALGAYGWYAQKPGWMRYLTVAGLFACSLMSKPMAVTFPFVLLLLDYWPLGRIAGGIRGTLEIPQKKISVLILEKVPLLAFSAASSWITLYAQQSGGAVRSATFFPFGLRVENAVVAYATYGWKMLWPARLAPLYPYPGAALSVSRVSAAIAVLAGVSILVVRAKRFYLVGWLWFLGTLVPVIGLVQIGEAAMADRYAYIPLIGIFGILAFGFDDLAECLKVSIMWRAIPAICVVVALSLATVRQLSCWKNSYDLWSHAVAVTGPNFVAQDNLGGALLMMGRTDDAYPHFLSAAEINPRDPMSHSNIGAYLQEHGLTRQAVEEYQLAISLTSDRGLLALAYANLGTAQTALGDDEKARQCFERSLRLNPAQYNAYLGRGILLEKQGKLDEAILNYARSVQLAPSLAGYLHLGHALQLANRRAEALAVYETVLKISPDVKEAQDAVALLSSGH